MAWGLAEFDAEQRGFKNGISQGLQQGFSLGAEQTRIETAKNLLNMGLTLEQVAQGTLLPMETVIKLQEELANS